MASSMASSSKKKYPDFFKVYLPEHCQESLKIPDAFLDHVTDSLPQRVVLRNRVGKFWRVKLEQTEDGALLKEGWSRVVLDNSIQVGDFLVFEYNGHHMFDFKILRRSGCEEEEVCAEEEVCMEEKEELEESTPMSEDSTTNVRLGGRGKNYSVSGYCPEKLTKGIEKFLPTENRPFFVTKLRTTRKGELTIPYHVRTDFGLKFGDSMKLQDPQGNTWDGQVVSWKDGRVWLKEGWNKLCRWNKVTFNDTLICELVPTTGGTCELMKVQIIREGSLEGDTASS